MPPYQPPPTEPSTNEPATTQPESSPSTSNLTRPEPESSPSSTKSEPELLNAENENISQMSPEDFETIHEIRRRRLAKFEAQEAENQNQGSSSSS
uniref:Uncharacterized protein n=1 Tax=Acrobeloides nanus TaxID=290746 RepID=A0A914DPB7_9BILA